MKRTIDHAEVVAFLEAIAAGADAPPSSAGPSPAGPSPTAPSSAEPPAPVVVRGQ